MKTSSKKGFTILIAIVVIITILVFVLLDFLTQSPPKNIPISVFSGDQGDPQFSSDGLGGAIIAWNDTRNGDFDIYAQRLDANGNLKWKKNGIPVSKSFGAQRDPRVISVNKKETIIAWSDTRNGDFDIYAQRLDKEGNIKWEKNGIPVIIMGGDQRDFKLLAHKDNLFVVWSDYRERKGSIYAQKLDSKGRLKWGLKGLKLSSFEDHQDHPQISQLSSEEFIVVWEELDDRLVINIKAQKITKDGELKWPSEGVSVAKAPWDQVDPRVVSDGRGDAIIVWEDRRSGKEHIYVQKIDKDGKVLWKNNGILLAESPQYQWHPELVSDGKGGAVVVWKDDRAGDDDVYVQKINRDGEILWGSRGFPLATAKNDQSFIKITKINQDWAGVVWKDSKNNSDDIFAQIVSLKERKKKTEDGYPVSFGKSNQQDPQIVEGNDNDAIIVWSDYRNGRHRDVYGAILKFTK